MDFLLDDHQKDLQRRARAFFDEVLEPMELEVDAYGGLEEHRPRIRQAVRNTGFAGINHSLDDGGHGFSIFEQSWSTSSSAAPPAACGQTCGSSLSR